MSTARRRARNVPLRQPKPVRLPLISSDELLAAFRRLGFQEGPAKGSSHLSMHRARPGGGHDTISVVLGKKEIPRGTLAGMLDTGRVTPQKFLKALKRKR